MYSLATGSFTILSHTVNSASATLPTRGTGSVMLGGQCGKQTRGKHILTVAGKYKHVLLTIAPKTTGMSVELAHSVCIFYLLNSHPLNMDILCIK